MQITVATTTVKKEGAKNGKPWAISEVTTTTGQKFDTFDTFTQGETCEVDVTANENPKYNANIKRAKSQKYVPQDTQTTAKVQEIVEKNEEKERRITMLSCISSACNYYQQRQGTTMEVKVLAQELFDLVWKKQDSLPF